MTIKNGHEVSVTQNMLHYSGITTDTEPMTTVNFTTSRMCEAREYGICCQEVATQTYTTDPLVTRYLCDYHFRRLLRTIRAWYALRSQGLEASA